MFEKHITMDLKLYLYQSILSSSIFENIITPEDISYFLNKYEGQLERSSLFSSGKMDYIDESIRDSLYFDVPEDDIRADSLFTKLRTFEGNSKDTLVEASRIQRYYQDGNFSYHFDALSDSDAVEASATGFQLSWSTLKPMLNSEDRYEIIDCSGDRNGTTFRPIAGNALFWMNVRGDGRRHPATIHAGLPVETGAKTIWNIWLWQDGSKIPVWLN
ncbi:hypothetical protein DPV78_006476 [Talaromyces pinophilus]|nr:hypothetical protein DPV78_006476 [Talaromyces pinophilus]